MKIATKLAIASLFGLSMSVQATVYDSVITFDDAIDGATSHFFDADLDLSPDVILSTTDPFGFNTIGPGPNQLYISEPGLEGTAGLTPDLRIDFLQGAVGSIGFGFAMLSQSTGVIQVFDENHNRLASQAFVGEYFDLATGDVVTTAPTVSDLPPPAPGDLIPIEVPVFGTEPVSGVSLFSEGRIDLPFSSTAAYATIDFNSASDRYIIDDVSFNSAGTTTLNLFAGANPELPVLPDPFDPANPEFNFELEILSDGIGTVFPVFIDPVVAIGYTYTVNSGPNVASILIPTALANGDSDFTIIIDGISYMLTAGVTFDVFAETGISGGISSFEIRDISTNEALDPTDNLAFNTGLTFVSGGIVNVTQTPITVDTTPAIPVPGTLALLSLGLLGLGSFKKRQTG